MGHAGVNLHPGQTPLNHFFSSLTLRALSKFRQVRRRDELPYAKGQKRARTKRHRPSLPGAWILANDSRAAQGRVSTRKQNRDSHAGFARYRDGLEQIVAAAQSGGHGQGAAGPRPPGTAGEGPSRPPHFPGVADGPRHSSACSCSAAAPASAIPWPPPPRIVSSYRTADGLDSGPPFPGATSF